MKPFFTLTAIGALAAASLSAQAQFTVDGKADATEIGTGIGKYQVAGSYTGNHIETDRGLKTLYVGYSATTLNIMVVGSAEATGGYRAFVVYLNTSGRNGAPAGVKLGGLDNQSPLKHKPTLDMQVDYGMRVSVGATTNSATDVYFGAASYVTGTGAPAAGTDTYIGNGSKAGAVVTAGATTNLPGAVMSYLNTANLTANTTNAGWEISIPLAALGTVVPVTVGSRIDIMAAYTDGDGVFYSELIPQIPNRTTALGAEPDFSDTVIPGSQSVGFVLGTGVVAATRSAVANGFEFQVYPNPARATSTIAYTVPAGKQDVSVAVYNTLGQRVRSLANTAQAGRQQFALGSLPAGSYLVKLQIGDQVTSRKVVME